MVRPKHSSHSEPTNREVVLDMEKLHTIVFRFLKKRKRGNFYDRTRVFRGRAEVPPRPPYLRLRRSRYSDAASAEIATTAIPLNSGTGMLLCSR
jgi:hypothetical protein